MGRRQRGGNNAFKVIKNQATKSLVFPLINKIGKKIEQKALTATGKIKNKTISGLLRNQIKAATPFLKYMVTKQIGGRRRRRRRRKRY